VDTHVHRIRYVSFSPFDPSSPLPSSPSSYSPSRPPSLPPSLPPSICSNRLGWANTWNYKNPKAQNPEKTRKLLESWMPRENWEEVCIFRGWGRIPGGGGGGGYFP
jgi:hypothetical protein